MPWLIFLSKPTTECIFRGKNKFLGGRGMPTIGTKEAASILGIKQSCVSNMCRKGKIPGAEQDRKGCPWHIPRDVVENLAKEKNK